jgi:hypothetical protein
LRSPLSTLPAEIIVPTFSQRSSARLDRSSVHRIGNCDLIAEFTFISSAAALFGPMKPCRKALFDRIEVISHRVCYWQAELSHAVPSGGMVVCHSGSDIANSSRGMRDGASFVHSEP